MTPPTRVGVALAFLAASALTLSTTDAGARGAAPDRARPTAGALCRPALDRPTSLGSLVTSRSTAGAAALARAAQLGLTPSLLAAGVAEDPTMRLGVCGDPIVEDTFPGGFTAPTASDERAGQASLRTLSRTGTFLLSSRPGADRVIYLDFLGGIVKRTYWNRDYTKSKPFYVQPWSLDADKHHLSTSELEFIQYAWAEVAEKYAPFDVDVTTKPPGTANLVRTVDVIRNGRRIRDLHFGSQMMITNRQPWSPLCSCSGIAHLNSLRATGKYSRYLRYAFVFTDVLRGDHAEWTADIAAHEAGHTFGLVHDGVRRATGLTTYYHGSPPWTPIMGQAFNEPLSQWSKGEYAGATHRQDDLRVIASLAPLVPDDHPDGARRAGTLLRTNATLGGAVGLIATRFDQDVFKIGIGRRHHLFIHAAPRVYWGALDISLTLYDARGHRVAHADPTTTSQGSLRMTGNDASISYTAPHPGIYHVVVDGAGQGDPRTTGYSDYASLGRYAIQAAVR